MAKRKLGKFKCAHCDRVFAMPAHLARHVSSSHAPGGRKPAPARKVAGRGRGRPAGFKMPAVAGADASSLMNQMQAYRGELLAQRAAVDGQIEAIERALTAFGAPAGAGARQAVGAPRGRRGRRGPREGSLKTYVEKVLQANGKPMAVKDVTDGVLKAGFKSENKTLSKSVGLILKEMPNVRKVDHGVFAMGQSTTHSAVRRAISDRRIESD